MTLSRSEKTTPPSQFMVSFSPEECLPRLEDAFCYLGGAGYQPKNTVRKRVDAAMTLAAEAVTPVATFSIWPVRAADASGVLLDDNRQISLGAAAECQPAAYLLATVATLGPGLEEQCRELSKSQPFSAIVLDAVGVAFLEKLGEKVAQESKHQADIRGLHCGPRISPGLNKVNLSLQPDLFDLVDHHSLGVKLNEDLVMQPFKSISEFRTFGSQPIEAGAPHKCRQCDLKACDFRRDSA